MRPLVRLSPLLLMIAMCAPLAQLSAQDSPSPSIPAGRHRTARYSIHGILRDATSSGNLDGVKVELRQLGGASVATVLTGASGDFVFNDIGSGLYEVVVDEVGYESFHQQISVADSVLDLQISLRKLNNPRGESRAPTISVRELSIPRKAHELMQKGLMLFYQSKDYRGSITQFERAIKEYPTYYEAYAQIGAADMELGDRADSEEALRKSIEVSDQRYAAAYLALAGLYLDVMRFADAEPVARKGAELDDSSWQGHYELANALYGLGRDSEAEPEAQAAARLQPDQAETHLVLANIHIHLHQYPAVLEDLTAYLTLDPNGANADQARHLQGQIQEALEKAQAAAQAESDSDADSDANSADDAEAEPQ
jgi:Carboxypeptidase regulatory-like domain